MTHEQQRARRRGHGRTIGREHTPIRLRTQLTEEDSGIARVGSLRVVDEAPTISQEKGEAMRPLSMGRCRDGLWLTARSVRATSA